MEKKFFDVFDQLVVSEDDRELLEETKVTRLVSSSRHDGLHVYLVSDHIVPKDRIYEMESRIRKQYYKDGPVSVRIIERFRLGSAYSPQTIIRLYKGSIMTEAAHINPAWSDLLQHADFVFPEEGNRIELVLEDRCLARDMSEDILDFLDHAINERCQTSFMITVSYKAKEERKSVEHSRRRMKEEIRMITLGSMDQEDEYVRDKTEEGEHLPDDSADGFIQYKNDDKNTEEEMFNIYQNGPVTITRRKETKDDPDDGVKEKSSEAPGKEMPAPAPARRRASKQSPNPDVIFGKDFTEGPMNICDIDGDIGEVVIRGQVCDYLVRDTRTGKKMVTFAVTDFTDTIDVKLFPKEDQQERLFDYIGEG